MRFGRMMAAVLALVMVCSMIVPVAAADIEEVSIPDFVWELDFDKMTNLTDNRGSDEYELQTPGSGNFVTMTEFDGRKVLGIKQSRGQYYIVDSNNILDKYDTFFIEADMYFESYPTADAGTSPNDYPMSFLTWMTKNKTKDGNYAYRSIRVDAEGYLCTAAKPDARTEAKLPLGEWFNIRFVVSPLSGMCEVQLNNQSVLSYKLGAPVDMAESIIRFFDVRYNYSVYFSGLSVYSDSSYRIGLVDEVSADYVGYQTTEIHDDAFDVRMIAGLDSLDYAATGFVVTTLWENNGDIQAKERDIDTLTVYESLKANGKTVTAAELGSKYLVALPVEDIDATKDHVEIVIRPYVKKNGVRTYGDAIILMYMGEKNGNYPVLESAARSVEYTASASDDTHIRRGLADNFGDKVTMELKNNGETSSYTRDIYMKFSFSENAVKKVLDSSRIYLEFYVNSCRALTEDEEAEGGILADVYGVEAGWTESALNGKNNNDIAADIDWISDVRYQSGQYTKVDVTEHVLKNLDENGQVAFRICNVENDGSSGQMQIASSEGPSNHPRLSIYPILYSHEVNLSKLLNEGYEPWGYAESIVDEWFETDRKKVWEGETYDTIDLEAVDNTAPNGAYTIKSEWQSSSPNNKWNSRIYARSLDTLIDFKPGAKSQYDEFGGITNSGIKGQATGYFHTEKVGNRTYIIDPLGNPFFAIGINTIELGATDNQKSAAIAKFGSEAAFYKQVSDTMMNIGINTHWGGDTQFFDEQVLSKAVGLGCISGYMGNGAGGLGLSVSTGGSAAFLHNNTMNVFDPDFLAFIGEKIPTTLKTFNNSPYILGFYSDNEIPAQEDMLYCYLTIDAVEPVNAFSYATAWTWFMRATGKANPTTADITPELSEEFKAFVYNRYFKTITEALDAAGGGKYMYMGNRIHGQNRTSEGYLRAASQYVDILTVNLYGGLEPPIETIKYMYKYTGKPFIVTEFFAKGNDAVDMNGYALGNQTNAGWIVKTQEDRAIHYENYTLLLLESQTCVGWTWYRFRDNDQTIYQDAAGNLYRVYDYRNKKIDSYANVKTGEVTEASKLDGKLTVYYKGESDTSNLGSNKGIYDNKMNLYEELASAVTIISDNLFNIIEYFDNLHK